jgi:serine/threonine protein phosphatase PrpC
VAIYSANNLGNELKSL